MEPSTYFSLLPKDVRNIVDLNVLINLDYNDFIEYCQNNKCSEKLWRDKGLKDFKDFDDFYGKTNKSKYLRNSAATEFEKLYKLKEIGKEKLIAELRNANYRHQAKLLDFDGQYDNYYSFNYLITDEELDNIRKSKLAEREKTFSIFIPPNIENWLIWLRTKDNQIRYVLFGKDDILIDIFDFRYPNEQQRFTFVLQFKFPDKKLIDILRIYDVTTEKDK